MKLDFAEIIAVLESELVVGASLQRNLDAQKEAIVAWDVEALLAHVEAREVCLRGLAELESRRVEALAALPLVPVPAELGQLIGQIPAGAPEHGRLRDLQRRGRKMFMRLSAEDEALQALKQNLIGHIHEAMNRLAQQGASVYGGSGHASYCTGPGLIHEKA